VEELRQSIDAPLGAQVAAWFDRQDWLRGYPGDALLRARLRAADGLRLHQEATMARDSAEGWVVQQQTIALPSGLRHTEEVDPLVLALLGGCDGTVPLGDALAVLAAAHEVEESALAEVAVPLVAHLVERGFVVPA
jgi:hypothetical protein